MRSVVIGPDWASNRDLLRSKEAHVLSRDMAGTRHCILLHGWHSLYGPLLPLENALRAHPEIEDTRFWRVTYDSHWKSFTHSARQILALLRRQGVEPEKAVLVGFSMGGVVARAMVANGFTARGLVAIASPHLGPAPWMPSGDIGSLSIAPWGRRLAHLNGHPRDIKRRGDYHFYALTYSDSMGHHNHDRIVMRDSALGIGLAGIGTRQTIHLPYSGVPLFCSPHVRGMDPNTVTPAVAKIASLLAGAAN